MHHPEITSAVPTVLKSFELIGAVDDFSYPQRRPSSVAVFASNDGIAEAGDRHLPAAEGGLFTWASRRAPEGAAASLLVSTVSRQGASLRARRARLDGLFG